jgi:hypothetical protein
LLVVSGILQVAACVNLQPRCLSCSTPSRRLTQAVCTTRARPAPPISPDQILATRARPLHPAALASVPNGVVIVRVQHGSGQLEGGRGYIKLNRAASHIVLHNTRKQAPPHSPGHIRSARAQTSPALPPPPRTLHPDIGQPQWQWTRPADRLTTNHEPSLGDIDLA